MSKTCDHFNSQKLLKAKAYECEECIKTGDRWVHLRTCQECGVTLCCDNSPNKHATKHFHKLVLVKTGIRLSFGNICGAGGNLGMVLC